MSVSTIYVLHGIQNSSTFISQINSARPSPQLELLIAEAAGLPFPLFAGTMAANPETPFETPQVKTILDLTGALSSIVDLSGANTDLYFKKVQDLGRRVADATTVHLRFRMAQAFLALDRITAGHKTPAVASCRLGTTYDGTNKPIVPAGSLALAGTPTAAQHFYAGPVWLNTVSLPGVQETTFDFQRQLLLIGGDGELYNTFAAMMIYRADITIRCTEHAWQTYGLDGTALTAGSFYLRKGIATGRDADGSATHIKFAATAGLITVDESSGGGNEASLTTYRVTCVGADAATEPITVNTAVAITS
jgi:hypothetical protein